MHAHTVAETAVNQGLIVGENIIYLMGLSFVLGSFFTILILLLLDFMQRDRVGK